MNEAEIYAEAGQVGVHYFGTYYFGAYGLKIAHIVKRIHSAQTCVRG